MSAQPPPEIDPVSKFKALVPRSKDLLAKLMEAAATVFYQNSVNDNYSLKGEISPDRVDKCLEEFYAICDQMELLVKLALECNKHSLDSAKYTPVPVQISTQKPPDASGPPSQDAISFSQYLSTVRLQIRSAKEIHDLLLDCSSRLSDPASISFLALPILSQQPPPQGQQQPQPSQQQQTVTTTIPT